MTLMCIDRSQSPTHKGSFLQGRKSPENNNINHQNANHHRRNSCSPPLSKNHQQQQQQQQQQQDQVPNAIKSLNLETTTTTTSSSRKLERSASEPADRRGAAVQSNSSRYKTELCRPFEENGTCKYGDKCQFAHGSKELRSMARHPKYKTELCRTFHSTGLCPYGPRCHFIHNSEQSKKSLLTNLTGNVPPVTTTTTTTTTSSRPKALTSLGSAGDISPPSSHGGSPTGIKSFDDLYQEEASTPLSPTTHNNAYPSFGPDFAKSVLNSLNRLNDFPIREYCCSDLIDSVTVFGGDGMSLSPPEYLDNYSYQMTPIQQLSLHHAAAEVNFLRYPLFDRMHI